MARSRFDICLETVLQHEGGYADHPNDPGGATNLGITRKTLACAGGRSRPWALAKTEVRSLQWAKAARIYRSGYWQASKADSMSSGLDLALFDFTVNSEPDRAVCPYAADCVGRAGGWCRRPANTQRHQDPHRTRRRRRPDRRPLRPRSVHFPFHPSQSIGVKPWIF